MGLVIRLAAVSLVAFGLIACTYNSPPTPVAAVPTTTPVYVQPTTVQPAPRLYVPAN